MYLSRPNSIVFASSKSHWSLHARESPAVPLWYSTKPRSLPKTVNIASLVFPVPRTMPGKSEALDKSWPSSLGINKSSRIDYLYNLSSYELGAIFLPSCFTVNGIILILSLLKEIPLWQIIFTSFPLKNRTWNNGPKFCQYEPDSFICSPCLTRIHHTQRLCHVNIVAKFWNYLMSNIFIISF